MEKRLLATLMLSLAVSSPSFADSDLEQAINDESISLFTMTADQIIENNLSPLTRKFNISDPTYSYTINGNGSSGFNTNSMLGIEAKSIRNFISNGNGGAISAKSLYVGGGNDEYILTDNNAAGSGGAIYQYGLGIMEIADESGFGTKIALNSATTYGGGIAMQKLDGEMGGTLVLYNTSVEGNNSGSKGGGIYVYGGNLSAESHDGVPVSIKYNISDAGIGNDIYAEKANVDLSADDNENSSVVVGDMVLVNSKLTKSGNVLVENLALNNSVLDTADGTIDESEITNIAVSGTSHWNLDADFANEKADRIFSDVTGSGTLVLDLNPTEVARGDIDSLDLGINSVAGVTVNPRNLRIDDTYYTLSMNDDKTLNVVLSQDRDFSLQGDIADSEKAETVLTENYYTTYSLGELVNNEEGNRTYTINGKDGSYYSGVYAQYNQALEYTPSGITLTEGETLNIQDVTALSGFARGDGSEYEKVGGALIRATNADISITNPNNPDKTLISGNKAKKSYYGGAIYTEGGVGQDNKSTNSLTVDKATFKSNYAALDNSIEAGGAIYAKNIKNISITNTDFINNNKSTTALVDDGGAVYIKSVNDSNEPVTVTMENVVFDGNGGRNDLYINISDRQNAVSTVSIKDATFTSRTGGYGSASVTIGSDEYKYAFKSITLDNVNLYGNENSDGIYASGANTVVKNSAFTDNKSDSALNAILQNGYMNKLTVQDSTFENNSMVLVNTKGNSLIKDTVIRNNTLDKQHGHTGLVANDYDNEMTLQNVTFEDNKVVYNETGDDWAVALLANDAGTLNVTGSTFENNSIEGKAVMLYADYGSNIVLNDVTFRKNTVENARGGMIDTYPGHTDGSKANIYINAVDSNVVFEGNTGTKANDLYMTVGTNVYLNANEGKSINMEDIYAEHNPNSANAARGTNLYLNNNETSTGTLNIEKITLKDGASLNTQNNRIDDLTTIDSLSFVGSGSKLYIDTDLKNNTADRFNNAVGSSLQLYINILDAYANVSSGSIQIFDNAAYNLSIGSTSTIYGDNRYTFTQDNADKGVMNYSMQRATTLQDAISDTEIREYKLPQLTMLNSDLGELALDAETGTRDFTINGNDGILNASAHKGIQVNGTQDKFGTKLTVKNMGMATEFSNTMPDSTSAHANGSFISAKEADVNIADSLISGNMATAQGSYSRAQGGAVFVENYLDDENLHTTNIANSSFVANNAVSMKSAAQGGAVFTRYNNLNIENSSFENNVVSGKTDYANMVYAAQGGAVDFENTKPAEASTLQNVKLTVKNTEFKGNTAMATSGSAVGGALAIVGNNNVLTEAYLENVKFTDNNVTTLSDSSSNFALGGAIYNKNAYTTLKNVTFENNTATNGEETTYSDIYNVNGDNASVIEFAGGDVVLPGGIVNGPVSVATTHPGGAVYVSDGANITFADTASLRQGDLVIKNGTVTVNSSADDNILDRVYVAEGSTLTLNSPMAVTCDNDYGESENNGTIVNNNDLLIGMDFTSTPFNNKGKIAGDGNIILNTTFNNDGVVANNMNLTSNAVLNSKYENITGRVELNHADAEYHITNSEVVFSDAERIGGSAGKLFVGGNIVSDTSLDYTGQVYLTNGARITPTANGDAFQNVGRLIIGTGEDDIVNATLNILNGKVDAMDYMTNTELSIGTQSSLNVEMDWGDTFAADSVLALGDVKVSKIDVSDVAGGTSYQFVNDGFKSRVKIQDLDLITSAGNANTVVYDNTTGNLNAVRDTLANVINESDTAADENAYYNYSMDSNENGNAAQSLIGNVKITGNGNSVVNSGLTVGDGVNTGDVVLKDTNLSNINTTTVASGAVTVNENSVVTIQAVDKDVKISGTSGANKNAIYIATAGGLASTVILEADGDHVITVDDDIRSDNAANQLFFNKGKIDLNGVLDPLTAINTGAYVTRGGVDENISWQLFGGTLKYLNDNYLNNPAKPNAIDFNGGSLDIMNGAATNIGLAALNLNATSNIYVDVNASNQTMDTLTAAAITAAPGANLNVAGMNIYGTPLMSEFTTKFVDATLGNTALLGHVTSSVTTVDTDIYKYLVSYVDDGTQGYFKYNVNTGTNPYVSYNPALYAPSAAAKGAYITQLNNYDTAFGNLDQTMLMTREQRKALRQQNSYASADDSSMVYSPLYTQNETKGVWFRPYGSFETVQLNDGPDVRNNSYGMIVGGDTDVVEIGSWEGQASVYAGYNGSHQTFDGNGIYQNGGVLGLTGVLCKGNFFTALTANVGAHVADIKTLYGNADMTMLATGVASKTGYNWELFNSKMIIQPSWLMSYTFVNPFSSYTLNNGVRVESDATHSLQIAPGLKVIGNLPKGWQPYVGANMRWNLIDNTKITANDISLPETSSKPYVEYGLGIQKSAGERFTGYGQSMFRSGGRSGVSFTLGFRWAFGKHGK